MTIRPRSLTFIATVETLPGFTEDVAVVRLGDRIVYYGDEVPYPGDDVAARTLDRTVGQFLNRFADLIENGWTENPG